MNQLWKAAGAAAWGAAALGGLQPFLGPEAAEQLHTLCPGAQTVLVGAFPYYAGQAPGNPRNSLITRPCGLIIPSGINLSFERLSPSYRQVGYVLLTRAPVAISSLQAN